nr:hypothetical protein [Mycobacterium sp. SP-6446]
MLNTRDADDREAPHVKRNSLYSPALYAVVAVLSLALFLLNLCTHGTALGLIGTGGLAVLMGYLAYRAWSSKHRMDQE